MTLALLASGAPSSAFAAPPEDQWWQYRERHQRLYVEAVMGMPVTADDQTVEGGSAFSLAAGYWVMPWLSTEVLLDLGTVNLGGTEMGRRAQYHGVFGGIRLGLPMHFTPLLVASLGYRRSRLGSVMVSECGSERCLDSSPYPEPQAAPGLMASAEIGLQFNRGPFTSSVTAEVESRLGGRRESQAASRGRPGVGGDTVSDSAGPSRLAVFNLRLGMRF